MGGLSGTALVTGGGRGIGAGIARALASAGMRVAVSGRTAAEVESVAREIGGLGLVGDVTSAESVEHWRTELAELDLLVCNAGIAGPVEALAPPEEWWRSFEVNVLGVYRCCHAFAARMIERGSGRIVNVTSGSAYLPTQAGRSNTAYPASKAAVHRFSEVLADQLAPHNVYVFSLSPGHVQTAMTGNDPAEGPWTPPECAPRLVCALASGEFDALAGRYLHAEQDPPASLRERMDSIQADDLNAIRLRR